MYPIKKGQAMVSHRYNRLPLLPSGPGGIQRELVVPDLPSAKVTKIVQANNICQKKRI